MKRKVLISIFACTLLIVFLIGYKILIKPGESYKARIHRYLAENGKVPKAERVARPNDLFYQQRAFPHDNIPHDKYYEALDIAGEMRRLKAVSKSDLEDAVWLPAGPSNIPGRINDIAVPSSDPNTIYVAASSGGVFKSNDLGQSWTALFDDEGGLSIGALAMDPVNPQVLYAGSGDRAPNPASYEGNGIYKTTDGGDTWTNVGLPNSRRVSRIIVDPDFPDTVFAGIHGSFYQYKLPGRGVYRSPDGGANWEEVLSVGDSIGCIDLALHADSSVLLAAMFSRFFPQQSSVWRSTDRGATWTDISGTNGLPDINGRVGVTFGKTHNTCYLLLADNFGAFEGLYKSTDLGQTWTPAFTPTLNQLNSSWNGGWYFGRIAVSPTDPDLVFALGFDLYRSVDGGDSWYNISYAHPSGDPLDPKPHADQHAMFIQESDDNVVYLGNDGGVCHTTDRGDSWTRLRELPNTEFYAVSIDYTYPERLFGGTQDNGCNGTKTGGINDWVHYINGDGFHILSDFTDPEIVYGEWQFGGILKSYNGGTNFLPCVNGIYTDEPTNWNAPIVMAPYNSQILYTGTNRVYRTVDGAGLWTPYSFPFSTYATISTIGVARSDSQVVYAGTSNGIVTVTTDDGVNWANISGSLPIRYVTRITVDPYDAAIAYVTLSGYTIADPLPHIFRTTDYGETWTDISGNLPDVPVNDCIIDYPHDSTLYIATDVGVFKTSDLGVNWEPFGTGMPPAVVIDMDYHYPTRTLIAGTFGRSIFKTTLPCDDLADNDIDGIGNGCDNCPEDYNPTQSDPDFDLLGNPCDDDDDNDGLPDAIDNCDLIVNVGQEDADGDDIGDPCDDCPMDENNDIDTDGICGDIDNCPDCYNTLQEDSDSDGIGDSCDNCIFVHNPDQADDDEDGIGNECEGCCIGYTGNVDCSNSGDDPEEPDVSDIVRIIDFLYLSHDPLCCLEEADVNASGPALPEDPYSAVDISDITYLIDHLYLSHKNLPECP